MEPIEFKTLAGFRIKLFKHEIKQIQEKAFVSRSPGPNAETVTVGVNGATEVMTAWGEVHTVDEPYNSVDARVFGE